MYNSTVPTSSIPESWVKGAQQLGTNCSCNSAMLQLCQEHAYELIMGPAMNSGKEVESWQSAVSEAARKVVEVMP